MYNSIDVYLYNQKEMKDLKEIIEEIKSSQVYENSKNWEERGLNQSDTEIVLLLRKTTNKFLEDFEEAISMYESKQDQTNEVSFLIDQLPWDEFDTEEREFLGDVIIPVIKEAGFDVDEVF